MSDDTEEELTALNPNVTTIIGTVSTLPYTVNERAGKRRRAGFQVAVHRKWWDSYLEQHRDASTVFEVRCRGYIAEDVLEKVADGDRVVVTGHFEHGAESGDLELHADVVALALSGEPRRVEP